MNILKHQPLLSLDERLTEYRRQCQAANRELILAWLIAMTAVNGALVYAHTHGLLIGWLPWLLVGGVLPAALMLPLASAMRPERPTMADIEADQVLRQMFGSDDQRN